MLGRAMRHQQLQATRLHARAMAGEDWYDEFVDRNYDPAPDDLIVLFRYKAASGISQKEALGRIASESSVGTWTTLAKLPKRIQRLKAQAYAWNKDHVKVAYPLALWEPGSLPQLLSGIAGNIFGMKAVAKLRLVDVTIPPKLLRTFPGPSFGIPGVRKRLQVAKRPLTATVPKPKLGYSAAEHASLGYEVWTGGVDLVKDDENLTDQAFNRFEDRVTRMAKLRDKAEKETGERKSALLNVTAETDEMVARAKLIAELGWEYAMVDVVTVGPAAVQTIRRECGDLGLAIHAHRAMHAMFTKDPAHGMAMPALAKFMRAAGVDNIHVGSVVGKLESPKEETLASVAVCRDARTKGDKGFGPQLPQDWGSMRPIWPVPSGGLHPGLAVEVYRLFGPDMLLQAGGGVLGHPDGAVAGARALRQALDAAMEGVSLKEAAFENHELSRALDKWGKVRPR